MKKTNAPRTIKVNLRLVDETLRKAQGTTDKELFVEGPEIPIHLAYIKYRHVYKLKAYRNGKLIYRKERKK